MEAVKLFNQTLPGIQDQVELLRSKTASETVKSRLDKKIKSILTNRINTITTELLMLNDFLIDYEACTDENERSNTVEQYKAVDE